MQWCKGIIASFVSGSEDSILFVPYAAVDFSYKVYTQKVNDALSEFGISVTNIDDIPDKQNAIKNTKAIFVGGGNTFHLLKKIQELNLVDEIQQVVKNGTYYVGWSAGSNLAAPTICTTNDMPIVQPHSFDAFRLINFQINPHYTEQILENHGGESRTKRLQEYLAVNKDQMILCMPEGTHLRVIDDKSKFYGEGGKLMKLGEELLISDGFTFQD